MNPGPGAGRWPGEAGAREGGACRQPSQAHPDRPGRRGHGGRDHRGAGHSEWRAGTFRRQLCRQGARLPGCGRCRDAAQCTAWPVGVLAGKDGHRTGQGSRASGARNVPGMDHGGLPARLRTCRRAG